MLLVKGYIYDLFYLCINVAAHCFSAIDCGEFEQGLRYHLPISYDTESYILSITLVVCLFGICITSTRTKVIYLLCELCSKSKKLIFSPLLWWYVSYVN